MAVGHRVESSQSPVGESRLHAVHLVSESSLQGAGFLYVEGVLAVIPVLWIPGNIVQVHQQADLFLNYKVPILALQRFLH